MSDEKKLYRIFAPVVGGISTETPISFGSGIELTPLPGWLIEDMEGDSRVMELPTRIALNQAKVCFHSEAKIKDLYPEDKVSGASSENPEYQKTIDDYQLTEVALWLTLPSAVAIGAIFFYGDNPPFRLYLQMEHERRGESLFFREKELRIAADLHKSMVDVERHTSLWNALKMLSRALKEMYWDIRFLNHWIILETLFGVSPETSYRMCLQMILFSWEGRTTDPYPMFKTARSDYGKRSEIAHGLRGARLRPEEKNELMNRAEDHVRESLIRILLNPPLQEIFQDDKKRQEYLEKLPLGGDKHITRYNM